MVTYRLTLKQARRFLLRHHGLIGAPRFEGKQGVLDFVRQCGCIQFDPIDVCGKNAELVLQARVKGFTKQMLYDLLYKDRLLVDYFDKQLAIIPAEDWPYFARERAKHMQSGRSRAEVDQAAEKVRQMLADRECVCSQDLSDMTDKVDWYWTSTNLGRAVLETLYFRGELGVHHKQGTIKHYAPMERLLPAEILSAQDPHVESDAYRDWQTLRRIRAVGLLRGRASDAFLCIDEHKGGGRAKAFESLHQNGKLVEILIDDINEPFYAATDEIPLLEEILDGATYKPRTELIAPLDCFMWDRKLIQLLFGFVYTWEIYTPQAKRQYGYYVLPLIHGEGFVGRVEVIADQKKKTLQLRNVWWEGRACPAALTKRLQRFAKFNGCETVEAL